jgi:FkbM family methyltransferase
MRKVLNTVTQAVVTYSQNDEDIILASFFPDVKHGKYVDIGAAHPDYLSVTKYFYMRGWSGVNVEPNERLYNLISRARPRDNTYNVAISNYNEKVAQYREYLGDGLSTLSRKTKEGREGSDDVVLKYYRDYDVSVMKLSSVLAEADLDEIHFMKVDVEGSEYEVLSSNDWTRFRPHIVCIEVNHMDEDLRALMKDWQYELSFHDGLNDYYADMTFYDTLPTVNYNFIYSSQILSATWAERIEALEKELREKESELTCVYEELSKRPAIDGRDLRFRTLAKVILRKTDEYVTGKIVSGPSKSTRSLEGVPYDDLSSYDRATWDVITRTATGKVTATPTRRAILAGYKAGKHMVKKASKIIKGKKS